jgi:hypothetical protein
MLFSDENFYSIKPTANPGQATAWRGEVTPRRDEDGYPPILVGTVADPTIIEKTERPFFLLIESIRRKRTSILGILGTLVHFRHFFVPLIL